LRSAIAAALGCIAHIFREPLTTQGVENFNMLSKLLKHQGLQGHRQEADTQRYRTVRYVTVHKERL
jgi:hypothetical protein